MNPNEQELTADDLLKMIDRLVSEGTQHINVDVGTETCIQTVRSTDCGRIGACAVPNFDLNDEDMAETEDDSADLDF